MSLNYGCASNQVNLVLRHQWNISDVVNEYHDVLVMTMILVIKTKSLLEMMRLVSSANL